MRQLWLLLVALCSKCLPVSVGVTPASQSPPSFSAPRAVERLVAYTVPDPRQYSGTFWELWVFNGRNVQAGVHDRYFVPNNVCFQSFTFVDNVGLLFDSPLTP